MVNFHFVGVILLWSMLVLLTTCLPPLVPWLFPGLLHSTSGLRGPWLLLSSTLPLLHQGPSILRLCRAPSSLRHCLGQSAMSLPWSSTPLASPCPLISLTQALPSFWLHFGPLLHQLRHGPPNRCFHRGHARLWLSLGPPDLRCLFLLVSTWVSTSQWLCLPLHSIWKGSSLCPYPLKGFTLRSESFKGLKGVGNQTTVSIWWPWLFSLQSVGLQTVPY